MRKNEKWIKLGGTVLCEIFTVFTIIMLLKGGEPGRLVLALSDFFGSDPWCGVQCGIIVCCYGYSLSKIPGAVLNRTGDR